MAVKDLSLRLTPVFASASADKAIEKQQKALKSTQTTMERLNKDAAKGLKEQESLWKRLGHGVENFSRTSLRAMDSALSGVNRFQRGLEGAVKGALNFRNLILGSAVGGAAFGLGRKILREGASDVRNLRKVRREFGDGFIADSILSRSKEISKAAGIQDDDAAVGLIPIARAIQDTKIGDMAGGKRINNAAQLRRVQEMQFAKASKMFSMIATLNPELGSEQIGHVIAQAGIGEEGLNKFASLLFGERASATVAKIKKQGKGKKMGTGDMMSALMKQAGITDESVAAESGSFEHQMHALGSSIQDTLGEMGSRAIDRINAKLGDGKHLAERWAEVMERNQPTLDKLADGFARVAESAADLALKLPEALSWLDKHKDTIMAVAGVYAGLRVVGAVRGTVGNALGGLGSVASKALGGATGTPVYITNWNEAGSGLGGGAGGVPGAAGKALSLGQKAGLLGGALAVGLGVGTAADQLSGGRLSGGLARALNADGANQITENMGVQQNAERLAKIGDERRQRIALLQSRGIDKGAATFAADNPTSEVGMATLQRAGINLNLGGLALNIGATVGQNAPEIVKKLMPDLQEQITRAIMAAVPAR